MKPHIPFGQFSSVGSFQILPAAMRRWTRVSDFSPPPAAGASPSVPESSAEPEAGWTTEDGAAEKADTAAVVV